MRYAYILPNLHKTGGTRVALELGREMISRGDEFSIVIPTGRIRVAIPKGVNVIECGIRVNSPLWAVPMALMAMRRQIPEVDILLASMPPYALFAQKIAKERHIPMVNMMLGDDVTMFDDHSYIKNEFVLRTYKNIARRSLKKSYIFVNSHWTGVQLLHHSGRRPDAIIHSGYNDTVFHCENLQQKSGDIWNLVTVGRHSRTKGFQDVVKALNVLSNSKLRFRLQIITNDNLDLSQAHFQYELLRPENDEDMAEYYKQGDIYIHASWCEGFGLPPLEAMACGLAVVASDSGGVKEFLRHGENCLLTPPKEPKLMAEAIKRLITHDNLRARCREQGRATIQEFTWKRIGDKFCDAISKVTQDFNHNG